MRLRKMELIDAPLMLEWMHDENVTFVFQATFQSKTLEDCQNFIKAGGDTKKHLHLAIVDDHDTYMGTVSLKNIDPKRQCAEFAIAMRSCSMGKGFSRYGMREIIRIGLEERNLKLVYWNVRKDNLRAVHFYDKMGYERISAALAATWGYSEPSSLPLWWYAVEKDFK